MIFWTAFTLGLFGSLHCVGMCGPLLMALPAHQNKDRERAVQLGLYQIGRIGSYTLIGFTLGWLGWGARIWNGQSQLAIVSGVLLLLLAAFRIDLGNKLLRFPAFGRFQLYLRQQFAGLFQRGGHGSYLGVGALNGLLPCGLVYAAVIGAVNAGHPLTGALFMLIFGLGTTPLLLSTVWFGAGKIRRWGVRLPGWTPVVLAMLGVFLIWRGVNLDLPTTFDFWRAVEPPPMCH